MMDLQIIVTGCLVACSCALVGSFMMLRKITMLGDAISHAVLPGIVLAFLLTESRNPVPLLIGAGALGMLTSFLTEWLHRKGGMYVDAAMGTVFTFLFAVGVILVSVYTRQVDLDQDCVLYGEIAYTPLELESFFGITLPRAIWQIGSVLVLCVAVLMAGYKELKLCAFDAAYAAAIGISTTFWHYALMGMVSMVTVASFESVGAILVVALLVAPPATAYLLSDRLSVVIMLALLTGCLSAVGGYYLAAALNASIAGGMTVVLGICFTLAFFFSPTHGILKRIWIPNRGIETSPIGELA